MLYIKTVDDTQIAFEDINKFREETIVFVHGWPFSHKIFEYQYDFLVDNGYRCIALDLRGFGESDTTAGGYSYNGLANDLYELISSIKTESVTLVGFSMGGAIALRYMSIFRGYKVKKLALLAAAAPTFTNTEYSPCGMTKEEIDGYITQAYQDRPRLVSDFQRNFFANKHSQQLNDWFYVIGTNASGIGTIKTAISLRDEIMIGDVKHITVPTGIFHGKKDLICPYEKALELNEEILGSKLFTFEDSGHGVFYDELDHFNDTFLDFLLDQSLPGEVSVSTTP